MTLLANILLVAVLVVFAAAIAAAVLPDPVPKSTDVDGPWDDVQ